MSVQDSYVDRRSKGQVFSGAGGDQAIVRALAAKSNAMRRLERQGRKAKISARMSKNSWAA